MARWWRPVRTPRLLLGAPWTVVPLLATAMSVTSVVPSPAPGLPALTLTPTFAAPRVDVQMTSRGLAPGPTECQIIVQPRAAFGVPPPGLVSCFVDSSGELKAEFPVPITAAIRTYAVEVFAFNDAKHPLTEPASLTVPTPKLDRPAPAQAPPGQQVQVTGSGWTPGGTCQVTVTGLGPVASCQVDATGTLEARLQVPANAVPGPAVLQATNQLFKFGVKNPQSASTHFRVSSLPPPASPTRRPSPAGSPPVTAAPGPIATGHHPPPPWRLTSFTRALVGVSLVVLVFPALLLARGLRRGKRRGPLHASVVQVRVELPPDVVSGSGREHDRAVLDLGVQCDVGAEVVELVEARR